MAKIRPVNRNTEELFNQIANMAEKVDSENTVSENDFDSEIKEVLVESQEIIETSKDTSSVENEESIYAKQKDLETQKEFETNLKQNTITKEVSSKVVDSPRHIKQDEPTLNNEMNHKTPFESISVIIKLADLYRSYDDRIKKGINRLIKLEKEDNIARIVFEILNTNQADKDAIIDLVELKEEERPSRAFSLVSLSEDRLENVANYVMLFNPNFELEESVSNKIKYCKLLESGIESLDQASLDYLKPINDLFQVK